MLPEINNYKDWINETDPELLKTTFENFLQKSGYTVISSVDYFFTPQGYTCVWLLAESHLAIHTFPEHHKTYLELTGCNKKMNDKFIALLENWKINII